jgi:hypothetical protein
VHELLAIALLVLVSLHLAGVVFESRRSHQNLALSMVTGWKRNVVANPADLLRPRRGRALVAIGLVAIAASLSAWWLLTREAAGVPRIAINAELQKNCGDCHFAFHPTLLPAESWRLLMAGLDDHFGEDASLPDDVTSRIASYLVTNAAEVSDTLPANVFRRVDPVRPFEITAAPFWLATHRNIDATLFTSKPVGARQNCAACHGDAASGLFAPQLITIPKEKIE